MRSHTGKVAKRLCIGSTTSRVPVLCTLVGIWILIDLVDVGFNVNTGVQSVVPPLKHRVNLLPDMISIESAWDLVHLFQKGFYPFLKYKEIIISVEKLTKVGVVATSSKFYVDDTILLILIVSSSFPSCVDICLSNVLNSWGPTEFLFLNRA